VGVHHIQTSIEKGLKHFGESKGMLAPTLWMLNLFKNRRHYEHLWSLGETMLEEDDSVDMSLDVDAILKTTTPTKATGRQRRQSTENSNQSTDVILHFKFNWRQVHGVLGP